MSSCWWTRGWRQRDLNGMAVARPEPRSPPNAAPLAVAATAAQPDATRTAARARGREQIVARASAGPYTRHRKMVCRRCC